MLSCLQGMAGYTAFSQPRSARDSAVHTMDVQSSSLFDNLLFVSFWGWDFLFHQASERVKRLGSLFLFFSGGYATVLGL